MGDWSSSVYITSQVLALVAFVLIGMTYYMTTRKYQLASTISGNALHGIHFLLLGAIEGAAVNSIAITRDIVSWLRLPPPVKIRMPK